MYKLQIRCSRCVFPKSAKSYNRCRRSVRQTYKLSEKVNKFRKDCHKIYHSNSLLRQKKIILLFTSPVMIGTKSDSGSKG